MLETPDGTAPASAARLGVCALLVLGVALVFGRTLGHGFVNYDDNAYVYRNPEVRAGLTPAGIAWALTAVHSSNWHPLTWLSHQLDCELWGLDPAGHHLTSLVLHAATAVVLLLALLRSTGRLGRSALVAFLFALHPLRVESVAWVAERKDVLSGLFFAATLWAWAGWAQRPSARRYGLVAAFLALGLASKPMLVTTPVVLLLLDVWPLRRLESVGARRLLLEKVPLLALAAASSAVTLFAQRGAMADTDAVPLGVRAANALVASGVYVLQTVWPARLALFYPLDRAGPEAWRVALAASALLAATLAALRQRRARPWLAVGWGWYLVMLAPVVGLVQVGMQAHADRYTYLPTIGLYLAGVWLAAELAAVLAERIRAPTALPASVLLAVGTVLALASVARGQVLHWRDSVSIWSRTVACTGDNFVARNNLGNALREQGRFAEALTQFAEAVRIQPRSAEAHNNLGVALQREGRLEEAIEHYVEAQRLQPGLVGALNNCASALRTLGRHAEARSTYEVALRNAPDSIETLNNLAWLLATCHVDELRDGPRAVELAERAARLTGHAEAAYLDTLSAASAEAGDLEAARRWQERALELAAEPERAAYRARLETYRAGRPHREPAPAGG